MSTVGEKIMMKKIIIWMLVALWMGVIFCFSAQEASQSKKVSSGVIKTVVKAIDFNDSLSDNEVENVSENLTFIVRKGAHFSAYALLCILISLLLKEYGICGKINFILSVIICFLYACSDEIHQIFVKGRSGEVRDVLIDTAGTITGYLFLVAVNAIRKKIISKKYS